MRQTTVCVLLFCANVTLSVSCRPRPEQYLAKANSLYDTGKYDEAILNYKKAIQKNTRFGEAYYRLGLAELRKGKTREAYAALSSARGLLPGRKDVRVTLADLLLVAYMSDKNRPNRLYQQLTSLSDELMAGEPNSYNGLRIKGNLAWSDGRLKEAEEFFQKANAVKPTQPDLILSWTQVLFRDGQQAEGERLALELIQSQKDAGRIYDVLFLHYRSKNRLADAENILRAKVSHNPREIDYALELAAFYAGAGKRDQMAAVLKPLLDDPKTFPAARLKVGDFYGALHDWPEALHQYEEGAKADSKNKTAYLKRITDAWLAQGKVESAAGAVGEIRKENPNDPAAKAVNASLLVNAGKPDQIQAGINDLQEVVKKEPDNPVYRFVLGRALMVKGDVDGAQAQFQESIRRRRDYLPAVLALAEVSQRKRDYSRALRYADQALSVNPKLGRARLLRAAAFMGQRNYNASRSELTGLVKDFPPDTEVQFQIAALDLAENKIQEAETLLEKLYEKNALRALAGLAEAYRAEGRLDKALSRLTIELAKSPNSTMLRSLLAETATQAGKYEVALQQYQQLLTLDPRSVQLRIRLGGAYELRGDLDKAVEIFQAAKEMAPNDPSVTGALADAFRLASRKLEALATYRRLLELEPENAKAMNNLAFLLANSNDVNRQDLDEAQRLAERALQKSPKDPQFADTLGTVYLKKDLEDSAVQVFSGLVHRYPDDPAYRYHYGLSLSQKGQKAKARSELEVALRKGPPDDLRREIQSSLARIQR